MMKKQFFSLCLLCALLLTAFAGCFTGCSQDASETQPDTTAEPVQETVLEPEPELDLPDVNYDGYSFRMGFREHAENLYISDIAFTENSGDIVEDAKYNRNLTVEELLNIQITPISMEGDPYGSSAVNSIMAGDKVYDTIAPHAHIAWSEYIVPGMALNWSDTMIHCNFDKPWWDQDSRRSLSVGGKIFTITGDFSYHSLGYSKALVFNKAILQEIGEEAPYETVLDGTWTFDAMKALAEKAVQDVNGNGSFALQDDRFGYVSTVWGGNIDVLYTSGSRTTRKDDRDIPSLSFMNEATVEIYDRYFAFMSQEGMLQDTGNKKDFGSDLTNAFLADRILFMDKSLLNLAQLREMESDWGILPWPKMDESIENYASNVDAGVHMIVVPIDAEMPERTSVVLEAMSYYGHKIVMPAFFEQALQSKYARDTYSSDMLNIIKATRVFDFGYFTNFSHNIGCAGNYLAKQSDRSIASYYAKHETAAQESLDTMINALVEH